MTRTYATRILICGCVSLRAITLLFSPFICARYRIVPNSLTRTLLHTLRPEPLRSDFRMYEKCLSARSMSRDQRRIITDQLESIAEQMYALNQRGRNYYLLKVSGY